MCFDTTASNTGKDLGAFAKSQERMKKKLYFSACRHHILELLPRAICDTLFGPSSGPNIPLFQKFSGAWDTLDQGLYHSVVEDPTISCHFMPVKDELINSSNSYFPPTW